MSRNYGADVPLSVNIGQGPWFVQTYGIDQEYTWQDLKDMVRPAASHVGHVAVLTGGRATITLRKWDEAVACFEFLSRSNFSNGTPYIELWETTPNQQPRRLWQNKESWKDTPKHSRAPSQNAAPWFPPVLPTKQQIMEQQMASLQLYQQFQVSAAPVQPMYTAYALSSPRTQQTAPGAMQYQVYVPQQPVPTSMPMYTIANQPTACAQYAPAQPRMLNTVRNDHFRTERRGVFVGNLSYDTQDKDLHCLFSHYGEIVKVEHKREQKVNSKGKTVYQSKGSAIITFASSDDAREAIETLHEKYWNERQLNVRFVKEAEPVDPPQIQSSTTETTRKSRKMNNDSTPLIVDGSKYGRKN